MRKRELAKQVERLTERLLKADKQIKELTNTLTDKNNEISVLKEKLLKAQEAEILENSDEICEEIIEQEIINVTDKTEDSPIIQNYNDFDFINQTDNEKTENIKDYAIKAIGKIVSESVKVNCILAGSSNENKKELINLVLGRTEIAKEEISSYITSELQDDILKSSIDKESAATFEYFKIILGQI